MSSAYLLFSSSPRAFRLANAFVSKAAGDRLNNVEETVRKVVVEMLQNEIVSCTSDKWQSVNNELFVSLTAHYINRFWEHKSLSLGCLPFTPSHNGAAIAEKVSEMLKGFGVHRELVEAFVADSDVNVVAGVHDNTRVCRNSCMAHTLDLVAGKM